MEASKVKTHSGFAEDKVLSGRECLKEFKRNEGAVYKMQKNECSSKEILKFIVKFTKKSNEDSMRLLASSSCKDSLLLLNRIEQFLLALECRELADIQSLTYINLACVCRELKDLALASKFLQKALDICELDGRGKYKALVYLSMCSTLREQHQHKSALDCAIKASLQCQEDIAYLQASTKAKPKTVAKRVSLLGTALYNMGLQEEKLGNAASALNWYVKGLNTLKSNPQSSKELKQKMQKAINRLNGVVLGESVSGDSTKAKQRQTSASKHKYLMPALAIQRAASGGKKSRDVTSDDSSSNSDSLEAELKEFVKERTNKPPIIKRKSQVTVHAKTKREPKKEEINKLNQSTPLKADKPDQAKEKTRKVPSYIQVKSPIDFTTMDKLLESVMLIEGNSYLVKFMLYDKKIVVIEAVNTLKGKKQLLMLPKELHAYVMKPHAKAGDVEIAQALAEFLVVKKTEDLLQFNWEKVKEFTKGKLDMTKEYAPLSKTLMEATMEEIVSKDVKGHGAATVFLNKEDTNIIIIQLQNRRIERKLSRFFTSAQIRELMNKPRKLRMTMEYYLPQLISSNP